VFMLCKLRNISILMILIMLCVVLGNLVKIMRCADYASCPVRHNVIVVLKEEYFGDFVRDRWVKVFFEQSDKVKSNSRADRISFYCAIAISCDLTLRCDRILAFMDAVGQEDGLLLIELRKIKSSEKYKKMSFKEKHNIDSWIGTLSNNSRYCRNF
jgi:hypothetical protein